MTGGILLALVVNSLGLTAHGYSIRKVTKQIEEQQRQIGELERRLENLKPINSVPIKKKEFSFNAI